MRTELNLNDLPQVDFLPGLVQLQTLGGVTRSTQNQSLIDNCAAIYSLIETIDLLTISGLKI